MFDGDASPAGNWQFQGDFDWDFFRDTDTWYQANFDPATGSWFVTVTDAATFEALPSAARAVIHGNTITWFIPASEFAAAVPLVRVTSFRHDGTFRPEVSAGDVSGADPTEAPVPVLPTEVVIDP